MILKHLEQNGAYPGVHQRVDQAEQKASKSISRPLLTKKALKSLEASYLPMSREVLTSKFVHDREKQSRDNLTCHNFMQETTKRKQHELANSAAQNNRTDDDCAARTDKLMADGLCPPDKPQPPQAPRRWTFFNEDDDFHKLYAGLGTPILHNKYPDERLRNSMEPPPPPPPYLPGPTLASMTSNARGPVAQQALPFPDIPDFLQGPKNRRHFTTMPRRTTIYPPYNPYGNNMYPCTGAITDNSFYQPDYYPTAEHGISRRFAPSLGDNANALLAVERASCDTVSPLIGKRFPLHPHPYPSEHTGTYAYRANEEGYERRIMDNLPRKHDGYCDAMKNSPSPHVLFTDSSPEVLTPPLSPLEVEMDAKLQQLREVKEILVEKARKEMLKKQAGTKDVHEYKYSKQPTKKDLLQEHLNQLTPQPPAPKEVEKPIYHEVNWRDAEAARAEVRRMRKKLENMAAEIDNLFADNKAASGPEKKGIDQKISNGGISMRHPIQKTSDGSFLPFPYGGPISRIPDRFSPDKDAHNEAGGSIHPASISNPAYCTAFTHAELGSDVCMPGVGSFSQDTAPRAMGPSALTMARQNRRLTILERLKKYEVEAPKSVKEQNNRLDEERERSEATRTYINMLHEIKAEQACENVNKPDDGHKQTKKDVNAMIDQVKTFGELVAGGISFPFPDDSQNNDKNRRMFLQKFFAIEQPKRAEIMATMKVVKQKWVKDREEQQLRELQANAEAHDSASAADNKVANLSVTDGEDSDAKGKKKFVRTVCYGPMGRTFVLQRGKKTASKFVPYELPELE